MQFKQKDSQTIFPVWACLNIDKLNYVLKKLELVLQVNART